MTRLVDRLTTLALWRVVVLAALTALVIVSLWFSVRDGSISESIIFGTTLALFAAMLAWIVTLKRRSRTSESDPSQDSNSA